MVGMLLRQEKGGANLKVTNATSKSYKSRSPCNGQTFRLTSLHHGHECTYTYVNTASKDINFHS